MLPRTRYPGKAPEEETELAAKDKVTSLPVKSREEPVAVEPVPVRGSEVVATGPAVDWKRRIGEVLLAVGTFVLRRYAEGGGCGFGCRGGGRGGGRGRGRRGRGRGMGRT